ncbi:response regulator transcription factor [Variovorax sp. LARHSF232]
MNHLTRNDHFQAQALGPLTALEAKSAWPIAPDLTPREREVLRWLATGKTDADIAAMLGISARTVQKHLEHMYVKLGVETRTAAVMRTLGTWGPNL